MLTKIERQRDAFRLKAVNSSKGGVHHSPTCSVRNPPPPHTSPPVRSHLSEFSLVPVFMPPPLTHTHRSWLCFDFNKSFFFNKNSAPRTETHFLCGGKKSSSLNVCLPRTFSRFLPVVCQDDLSTVSPDERRLLSGPSRAHSAARAAPRLARR